MGAPGNNFDLLVAHLERGDWQAAHKIVQEDEGIRAFCGRTASCT